MYVSDKNLALYYMLSTEKICEEIFHEYSNAKSRRRSRVLECRKLLVEREPFGMFSLSRRTNTARQKVTHRDLPKSPIRTKLRTSIAAPT